MQLFHSRLFLRIIYRNREVYALKIITLAIAFACSTLIILFSLNEFGYDRFHHNADLTFRVLQRNVSESHSGNRLSNRVPELVFNAMLASDSITVARVKVMNDVNVNIQNKLFHNQKVHAVDSTIRDIFSFHVLDGALSKFNSERYNAFISSSLAKLYFGDNQVAGRKLKLYTLTKDTFECNIIAVYDDFPQNAHETFDLFISFDSASIQSLSFNPSDFGVYGRVINESRINFESSVYIPPTSSDLVYKFQPLPGIYFGPRVTGEDARHGDYYSVMILISITGLILFLALFSFINLTMLTLPHRSRELAIKKLAGTNQYSLFFMFARETFSIVGISLVLGVLILFFSAGLIKPMLPIDLFSMLFRSYLWLLFIVAFLFLMLGIAPLFMTFKFIRATPNRLLSTETITFPRLKRIVTFLQLGISIFLIAASVVIKRQVNYSLLKEPGRNYDQVVYMSYPSDLTNEGLINIRSGWKKYNPNIVDVIGTSQLPNSIGSKELNSDFYSISVDPFFGEFFSLNIVDGSWFKANDGDSIMVVNEKGGDLLGDNTKNVRGVVRDLSGEYNLPEKPIKIDISPYFNYNFLCIRILEVDIRRTVNYLSIFYDPSKPAKVSYLNKRFEEWINYQDQLNALSEILAVISAVLSCCAIYGLSVSLVRDKLKEIAVHKLFGAGSINITRLLVKEFMRQMFIAIAVFGPCTYIFINEFLRNFVYSTKLNWLDPVFPLGYCVIVIVVLCRLQVFNLSRADLSLALKR